MAFEREKVKILNAESIETQDFSNVDCRKKQELAILEKAAKFLDQDPLGEHRVHKVVELMGHITLIQMVPLLCIGKLRLCRSRKIVVARKSADSQDTEFSFQNHFYRFGVEFGKIVDDHFEGQNVGWCINNRAGFWD